MKTQSFLDKYFAQAENAAHCILFYGADIGAQYELALNIAKKLNPDKLSQKWIDENNHPAVVTISKADGKTAISIEQAHQIKNSLALTSDFHRVFIFYDEAGLNQKNPTDAAVNSLLKIFEEPPERVTFFFLTKNKDDILGTIVSRAQSFYVPSCVDQPRDFPQEIDIKEIPLDKLQNYLLAALRTEPARLVSAMRDVEDAKKQLQLNMNEQNVRETLAFKLGL